MSSSYTQSFPLLATGAKNFNRKETAMTMIQKPNTVVSPPPPKRERNRAGNPNPDAEVIALSPRTIIATNRFICEVCNEGFKRVQNLQLHGRVHNLPWKLKKKSGKEVRSKVYICPEPTCVHHNPSRALGDLTGIKKHYYRKHCEKKWKCEKCPKRYALQSDQKSHSKTCGTKVYRCDCGTNFSRRDSYITHKTFCDTLKQESTKYPTVSFKEMAAAAGGSGDRHDIYGGAASALGREDFYRGAASSLGRQDFYGGAASALPSNQFGNNSNNGITPLTAGYNLNHSSSKTFEEFVPQPANPNPIPTNFLMQRSSNQGLLAHNDQSLKTQHDLISLSDRIKKDNNNNNSLNYFKDNTKTSNQTLFTLGADINNPSALLRGLTLSSSSSVAVNGFGDNENGSYQGLMNSTDVTTNQQGRSGSNILGPHFPNNNLSMGGSGMFTLDFRGVNGGILSNGRGGRTIPLATEMKFSYPNQPFGNA